MRFHMYPQIIRSGAGLFTRWTLEFRSVGVDGLHVFSQTTFVWETALTQVTFKRFLSTVSTCMRLQAFLGFKTLPTDLTHKGLLCLVDFGVGVESGIRFEAGVAFLALESLLLFVDF